MKLQHGLGGLEGLGPVDFEKRVFVEDWETRIFGIHVAMMGLSTSLRSAVPGYEIDAVPSTFDSEWTWASLRTGAEAMNPFDYFRLRYYEKWLGGITGFLVQQGYVTPDELDEAMRRSTAAPESSLPERDVAGIDDQIERYLRTGDSPRKGQATPRFALGDTVRVADPPAAEHTRLPGYLRGHLGTVTRVFEGNYGYFVDTGVDGLGEPVAVYVVSFDPGSLWGDQAEARPGRLCAELYETYLEAPR